LFKNDVEVFGVFESDFLGDQGKRKIGFGEQLFGAVKADAQDFLLGRVAEGGGKAPFQGAARERHRPEHVADVDAFTSVLANEAHRAGDVAVVHSQHFGGTA